MSKLKNLLPETADVLQKLAKQNFANNFCFVGGSALAVYLGHRLSEDIDLFTWNSDIEFSKIQNELETCGFRDIKLISLTSIQADFIINHTKVTFFASAWSELQNSAVLLNNLRIADLKTLAIMKVNTLFLRAKFRDYYDLFILNREFFSLQELFEMAQLKMKNLNKTLFQKALVFTGDIEDENIKHLSPKFNVTLKQIETHFTKQIHLWNKQKKKF